MGTRALIHVKEGKKTLVTLYRQYDGYPTGLGRNILEALHSGNAALVSGFTSRDKSPQVFNGMGCLAAYLVGALKNANYGKIKNDFNAIGNVYVMAPNAKDCGEEFIYTLFDVKGVIHLTVTDDRRNILYKGTLSGFSPINAEAKVA